MVILNKKLFKIFFLVFLLIIGAIIFAGSFLPSSDPAPTMYTLADIHNLIQNISAGSHTLVTTSSPVATTSYSISQIYADLSNLFYRENLKNGVTYLGVSGNYGVPDPTRSTTTVIYSSLDPAGPSQAQGYTLDDIYNLIINNTKTAAGSHNISPAVTPNSSMHTTSDIYNALTSLINSVSASKIKTGIVYFGKTGTYTGFSGGDGSAGNPYQIGDWYELNNVRSHLSSKYILIANLSSTTPGYTGLGDNWMPIGSTTSQFTGALNGNYNTISDFIMNVSSTTPVFSNSGLFGSMSNGSISNLGMLNVLININNTVATVNHVGPLTGIMAGGSVTNSYATGNILIGNNDGGLRNSLANNIGGLVGENDSSATISKCYSSVNIIKTSNTGYAQAYGGITGYCGANVSNSYYMGQIQGDTQDGGIVGRQASTCTVSNSFVAGGPLSSFEDTVGGLIGAYHSNQSKSFWDKQTTGANSSYGGTGTGTTTLAMKTYMTFATTSIAWNIATTSVDLNNGYPYLGWQNGDLTHTWLIYGN